MIQVGVLIVIGTHVGIADLHVLVGHHLARVKQRVECGVLLVLVLIPFAEFPFAHAHGGEQHALQLFLQPALTQVEFVLPEPLRAEIGIRTAGVADKLIGVRKKLFVHVAAECAGRIGEVALEIFGGILAAHPVDQLLVAHRQPHPLQLPIHQVLRHEILPDLFANLGQRGLVRLRAALGFLVVGGRLHQIAEFFVGDFGAVDLADFILVTTAHAEVVHSPFEDDGDEERNK